MNYSVTVKCPQCLREMDVDEMLQAGLYAGYSEEIHDVACSHCSYEFKVKRFPVICYEVEFE